MGSISARFAAYSDMGKDITLQTLRLAELEAAVGNHGAAPFGSVGHGAGTAADPTGRLAGRIADLKTHLRELTEKERREERALNAILRTRTDEYGTLLLSARERAIIQMRYFDRLTWEQAAELLGMSDRGVILAFRRGLDKLDGKYDADEA